MAQINSTVGDLKGNIKKIREYIEKAENLGICFVQFSIQDIVESYKRVLEDPLEKIRRCFGVGKEMDDPSLTRICSPGLGETASWTSLIDWRI